MTEVSRRSTRRSHVVRRESQIPAAEFLCNAYASGSRALTRSPAQIALGLCDIVDRNRQEEARVAADRAGLVANPNHTLAEDDRRVLSKNVTARTSLPL